MRTVAGLENYVVAGLRCRNLNMKGEETGTGKDKQVFIFGFSLEHCKEERITQGRESR